MSERSSAVSEVKPEVRGAVIEWIARSAVGIVVSGPVRFLAAGTWRWLWGAVLLAGRARGPVGLRAVPVGHSLQGLLRARSADPVRVRPRRGRRRARRKVRHPGYAGTILAHLGTAVLLGSPWALIPAGL